MTSNILKTGMNIYLLPNGTGFAVKGEKVFFAARGAADCLKPFARVPEAVAMGVFVSN